MNSLIELFLDIVCTDFRTHPCFLMYPPQTCTDTNMHAYTHAHVDCKFVRTKHSLLQVRTALAICVVLASAVVV